MNSFYVEFLDRAENDPNLFFPEQPWQCMDITIVCNACENYFVFFLNINFIVFPYMFLGSVVEKVLFVSLGRIWYFVTSVMCTWA